MLNLHCHNNDKKKKKKIKEIKKKIWGQLDRHCSKGLGTAMQIRPEFFYFLVLGKFLGKPSVGGGNKNKNKIQKFPESE